MQIIRQKSENKHRKSEAHECELRLKEINREFVEKVTYRRNDHMTILREPLPLFRKYDKLVDVSC